MSNTVCGSYNHLQCSLECLCSDPLSYFLCFNPLGKIAQIDNLQETIAHKINVVTKYHSDGMKIKTRLYSRLHQGQTVFLSLTTLSFLHHTLMSSLKYHSLSVIQDTAAHRHFTSHAVKKGMTHNKPCMHKSCSYIILYPIPTLNELSTIFFSNCLLIFSVYNFSPLPKCGTCKSIVTPLMANLLSMVTIKGHACKITISTHRKGSTSLM